MFAWGQCSVFIIIASHPDLPLKFSLIFLCRLLEAIIVACVVELLGKWRSVIIAQGTSIYSVLNHL